MSEFFYLIPVSLVLGAGGLAVFLWSLKAKQYEDLDGAAERILFDDDNPISDAPAHDTPPAPRSR
jgi:cbb3-type cytochrome oxidase maturation protein